MSMRLALTGIKCFLVFLLVLMVAMVCMSSCSPNKKYKVLKFFFDGVPEQGSGEAKKETGEADKNQSLSAKLPKKDWVKIRSRHPDYFNNVCDNCHDRSSSSFLKAKVDRICFTCHDESKFEGKFVHGPVAVRACLGCHLPHESQYEKLLKQEGQTLCFECHDRLDLSKINPHLLFLKENAKGDCTMCHDPHASNASGFFLKTGVSGEP